MFLRLDEYGCSDEVINVDQQFASFYPEHTWVEDQYFSPRDHYIADGQVAERPVLSPIVSSETIKADGQELLSISGLPSPPHVTVLGPISEEWQEESEVVELTVNIPGSYTVWIECRPYKQIEVKFDAA